MNSESYKLYVKAKCFSCNGKSFSCVYCNGEHLTYVEASDASVKRWLESQADETKSFITGAQDEKK